MSKIRKYWIGMPIGSKMRMFIILFLLVVAVIAGFNMYTTNFSVVDVNRILREIDRCENAQEAVIAEETAFHAYVRDPSEETERVLNQAVIHSGSSISLLPNNYTEIGAERFAWTWRIKNAYQYYSARRDLLCSSLARDNTARNLSAEAGAGSELVDLLYQIYDMQSYLNGYLQSLSQLTVKHASSVYDLKYPMLQSIPYFQVLIAVVILLVATSFVHLLTETIVTPVQKLAAGARSISRGELEEEDIHVNNEDELGELVDTFNRMKHATRKNIHTLEENQRLADQLHKEAMDRAEMEKRLETTRMDLLQSQIKPHFLFNTLNTISGMAEIEEAETTDSMIRALSRLFRYNLHTTDQFVSLSQELEVARDYLYLQEMRFGDRVQYELPDLSSAAYKAAGSTMVPVFMLQPLIENAIIHGITPKEQGGKITISAEKTGDYLEIKVADTGVGMDPDTLEGLKRSLRGEPSDVRAGIGTGNLYQRLRALYGEETMRIDSAAGEGTKIVIRIPAGMQKGGVNAENIDRRR